MLCRNAGAVVTNGNLEHLAVRLDSNADMTGGATIFDRVLNEIFDNA